MPMRRALSIAAVAAAVAVLGACGVTGNLRFHPGYADLGSPGRRDTDRELGLSIGPLPLRFARMFFADDPELAAILRDIRAVRVYVYEVDGDAERVHARIDAARNRLVERGWHPIVAVRDDGELVSALVRMDGPERIHGLAVMVQDDEDVVLVNVIGRIEPETFAFVMDEVGVDLTHVSLGRPKRCGERPIDAEPVLADHEIGAEPALADRTVAAPDAPRALLAPATAPPCS